MKFIQKYWLILAIAAAALLLYLMGVTITWTNISEEEDRPGNPERSARNYERVDPTDLLYESEYDFDPADLYESPPFYQSEVRATQLRASQETPIFQ